MGEKKKIGVCTAMLHQLSMHRMINSFCQEAEKHNYELHILAPFSNLENDTDNDFIQQKIFDLIEYLELDAIVVFAEMVKASKIQNAIFECARQKNLPIIGVKSSIDGIININYDVDSAIKKIVSHLIEFHDCKTINFISGSRNHAAFDFRIHAYKNALTKYNLPIEEERILYGGFWSVPTIKALDEYIASGFPMPEAFVCANDAMAIATISYLQGKGFRVPQDIKVAGIGGICEREFHSPLLTTGKYDPDSTSKIIADTLDSVLIEKKIPTESIRIPCVMDYTESCGCMPLHSKHVNNQINLYEQLEKERSYRHDVNEMIVATNSDCDIQTLLDSIPYQIKPTGIKSYNLYMMSEYGNIIGLPLNDLQTVLPFICLSSYIDANIQQTVLKPQAKNDFIKYLQPLSAQTGHIIYIPIHSEKKMYGFCAMAYDSKNTAPEFLFDLCVTINICFDSIAKRYTLDEANRQLRAISEQTIQSLAEIVEAKSEVTGHHVKRVSEYTKILAQGLGYNDEATNTLRIASMMHDVGKINVPSSILEKPGKLTTEELDVIKTHVTEGERILAKYPGAIMQKAKIIAMQHHEKWNGTGYLGMKEEAIDEGARIVALADVFDALVSKRPYKSAYSTESAFKIIVESSGTHFDPRIVECFKKNLAAFIKTKESYPDDV